MTAYLKKSMLAALSSLALASPLASASGIIEVYNESPVTIQPYFKSNCWGYLMPAGATGWIHFGNIHAHGGRFGWDFKDPALLDPSCKNPVVEFTYGVNNLAPPDPQKGNRRAATHFSPDANTVFQIGKSFYGKELEGPDENGR